MDGLVVSMNLIPLLAMMNQLSKKPNKTREEEEVLIGFKKPLASAVFVTLNDASLVGLISLFLKNKRKNFA